MALELCNKLQDKLWNELYKKLRKKKKPEEDPVGQKKIPDMSCFHKQSDSDRNTFQLGPSSSSFATQWLHQGCQGRVVPEQVGPTY